MTHPIGELAWNNEKKNLGFVCMDWEVGVREFMQGKRRGEEEENEEGVGLVGKLNFWFGFLKIMKNIDNNHGYQTGSDHRKN